MVTQPEDTDYPWVDDNSRPFRDEWLDLDRSIRAVIPQVLGNAWADSSSDSDETDFLIASTLDELRELLLFKPEPVVIDGEIIQRYLADYISEKEFTELRTYLSNLMLEQSRQMDSSDILSFLLAWIGNAAAALTMGGFTDYRVRLTNATSEEAAFLKWRRKLEGIELTSRRAINARMAANQAVSAAGDARRASKAAQEAAGATGNSALANHFAELASDEGNRAFYWTCATILSLLVSLAVGGWLSGFGVFDSMWKSVIGHLALLAPLVAIAGYTARIAHHHRKSALWASTTAVQLKTVSAYVQQLPSEESRENIVNILGARVFSVPDLPEGTQTDQVAIIPTGVIDILKDLVAGSKKDPA
ncbi:hypothetical protein [Nocardia sp. NPDC049149]|uniref:hypothetical protein n=1 Tax=Nocardia sp. NPDC049149 TaxID=3364315 RepID=UPI003712C3DB